MQMVQRAFEVSYGERGICEILTARNAIQGASQFRPGRLKLKNELLQVLIGGFFQAEFVDLVPELHGAFKTTMLQRMTKIPVLGPNPVNSFPVRDGGGVGLIPRGLARGGG